jgi:hypothetical protein
LRLKSRSFVKIPCHAWVMAMLRFVGFELFWLCLFSQARRTWEHTIVPATDLFVKKRQPE